MAMSRRIELYHPTKEDNTYLIRYDGYEFEDSNKQKCLARAMKAIRKDIMRSLSTRKRLKELGYL